MAYIPIEIPAGGWDYHPINYPEWQKDPLVNEYDIIDFFDDSTEEYMLSQFRVPSNIDPTGSIYLIAYGRAMTADGNEVQLRFSHAASALNEDSDIAYSDIESGDYATNAAQYFNDYITWDDTVANFDWVANDHVRIMLSRSAIDGGVPVSGDYGVKTFTILIPIP